MNRTLFISLIFSTLFLLLFMGETPVSSITLLYPTADDIISFEQGEILLVSAFNESTPSLLLSTQWETEKILPISLKSDKENFPKEFYSLFPQNTTVQTLAFKYKYFNGYGIPETLRYAYEETISIKELWKKKEFSDMVKNIVASDAMEIVLNIRGWQDSVYTPTYEDPTAENRTLYKLFVQLLPGENNIYVSSTNDRASALRYTTAYVSEAKEIADRTGVFHNSELEQNCTSCHEGLPSADNGSTMSADCSGCHKEKSASTFVHSPVKENECSTCHTWSSEKHAVVVESGTPEKCFGCHSEIQELVENSATPHPVASECGTCHTPHTSREQHLLKQDIYSLCTSCHEDYKINHPVGRHPLRYVKNTVTGEELSCVTCHSPHGSPNQALINVPGAPSQVCGKCH